MPLTLTSQKHFGKQQKGRTQCAGLTVLFDYVVLIEWFPPRDLVVVDRIEPPFLARTPPENIKTQPRHTHGWKDHPIFHRTVPL